MEHKFKWMGEDLCLHNKVAMKWFVPDKEDDRTDPNTITEP